jgi:hypothetical protein
MWSNTNPEHEIFSSHCKRNQNTKGTMNMMSKNSRVQKFNYYSLISYRFKWFLYSFPLKVHQLFSKWIIPINNMLKNFLLYRKSKMEHQSDKNSSFAPIITPFLVFSLYKLPRKNACVHNLCFLIFYCANNKSYFS